MSESELMSSRNYMTFNGQLNPNERVNYRAAGVAPIQVHLPTRRILLLLINEIRQDKVEPELYFSGGKREFEDQTSDVTAYREFWEETAEILSPNFLKQTSKTIHTRPVMWKYKGKIALYLHIVNPKTDQEIIELDRKFKYERDLYYKRKDIYKSDKTKSMSIEKPTEKSFEKLDKIEKEIIDKKDIYQRENYDFSKCKTVELVWVDLLQLIQYVNNPEEMRYFEMLKNVAKVDEKTGNKTSVETFVKCDLVVNEFLAEFLQYDLFIAFVYGLLRGNIALT